MDDRKKTARNVAILLLLAAAVAYLPGGARAAATFQTILGVVFMLGARLRRGCGCTSATTSPSTASATAAARWRTGRSAWAP